MILFIGSEAVPYVDIIYDGDVLPLPVLPPIDEFATENEVSSHLCPNFAFIFIISMPSFLLLENEDLNSSASLIKFLPIAIHGNICNILSTFSM